MMLTEDLLKQGKHKKNSWRSSLKNPIINSQTSKETMMKTNTSKSIKRSLLMIDSNKGSRERQDFKLRRKNVLSLLELDVRC